jgi:hypothetical protein
MICSELKTATGYFRLRQAKRPRARPKEAEIFMIIFMRSENQKLFNAADAWAAFVPLHLVTYDL